MRALLLVAFLWSPPAGAQPIPQQLVWVSESFGSCAFDEVTYFAPCAPEWVRMRANAEGYAVRVQNLSLPGVGTAEVWATYIDTMTSPLQCWFRPCWGVIMLGFSDPKFGRTHWEFLADLVVIADRLVAIGASRIVLAIETSLYPDGYESARELQRQVQLGMCQGDPARFTCVDLSQLDVATYFPQPAPSSAIHWNAAGQAEAGERIWEALQ